MSGYVGGKVSKWGDLNVELRLGMSEYMGGKVSEWGI